MDDLYSCLLSGCSLFPELTVSLINLRLPLEIKAVRQSAAINQSVSVDQSQGSGISARHPPPAHYNHAATRSIYSRSGPGSPAPDIRRPTLSLLSTSDLEMSGGPKVMNMLKQEAPRIDVGPRGPALRFVDCWVFIHEHYTVKSCRAEV